MSNFVPNLALLGTRFSYEDYELFYEETFVPMKVSNQQLLTLPEVSESSEEGEEPEDAEPSEEGEEEEEEDDILQEPQRQKEQVEDFDFGDDFWYLQCQNHL